MINSSFVKNILKNEYLAKLVLPFFIKDYASLIKYIERYITREQLESLKNLQQKEVEPILTELLVLYSGKEDVINPIEQILMPLKDLIRVFISFRSPPADCRVFANKDKTSVERRKELRDILDDQYNFTEETEFLKRILNCKTVAIDIIPKFLENNWFGFEDVFYNTFYYDKPLISREKYEEIKKLDSDKYKSVIIDLIAQFYPHDEGIIRDIIEGEILRCKEIVKEYIKLKFPDQFLSIFPEGESNLPQKRVRRIHDLLKTYYNLKL